MEELLEIEKAFEKEWRKQIYPIYPMKLALKWFKIGVLYQSEKDLKIIMDLCV